MRLFALGALTMIAFAANSVLNRMALAGDLIGPAEFGAVRVLAGAITLAALVWWRRGTVRLAGPGRVTSVLALLVYIFGFTFAYVGLDAGLGALILFGMVQITMFGGALLAAEPVPGRRWAGAVLAFGGLVYLLAPGDAGVAFGPAALMALAGIGWGVYSLAGRGAADALGATAANFVLAAPLALLVALLAGFVQPSLAGLALAVLSGAVTSGLGYALWYAILPQLGASRAAVAQLSVPVIAALGGAALLGEAPSLRLALAGALVLGGVAISLLPARRGQGASDG